MYRHALMYAVSPFSDDPESAGSGEWNIDVISFF